MRTSSVFLAAAMLAGLSTACGPQGRIEVIHSGDSDAARLLYRVAMTQQITVPDTFVMRPDEFGAVTVDHARETLYVGSREGTLLALDEASGEVIWELPMGGAVSSRPLLTAHPDAAEAEATQGEKAAAQKPGLDLLLVGTDNGDLVAIDLRTREEFWRYPTDGKMRSVPVVWDGVVYVANSRDQVYALDLRTGAWRWQYDQPLPADFTVAGYAGLTFVPNTDSEAEEPGVVYTGFGNGKVVAIGGGSGEALWISSVAPAEGGDFSDCDSTPLVDLDEGRLYVAGQSTGVHALSLEDGSTIWTYPMRAGGDVVRGQGNDLVVASSLEGVFSLSRDGERLWRTQVDPGVLSTPVVALDAVYVNHSERGLLTFDVVSGEILARIDPGSGMSGTPVYDDGSGRVYATSNRGVLFGLELEPAVDPNFEPMPVAKRQRSASPG